MKKVTLKSPKKKKKILENILSYINQGVMTHVKGRNAIYNQYFILRQITPARNLPPDLQKYVFKQNGVKHYISLYDVNPGEFQVLKAFFCFFSIWL